MSALLLKDESRNPSGSFKDRGLALAASLAVDYGLVGLICASTGNAAVSTATYAARAGLPCVVLVPAAAALAKIAHARACGATVIPIRGTYSDAHALAITAADELGWLNTTSTFVCPYTVEGARTVAFETWLACGVPDWVVVPIGAGPLLVALARGYEELQELGLADRVPRMLAVQPAGCAPIVRALQEGASHVTAWDAPHTVADGLADPLTGYTEQGDITMEAVRKSHGAGVAIDDADTLAAVLEIAHTEGLFQEPSSAIAIAGLRAAIHLGLVVDGDRVVACLTGLGLKEPEAALAHEAALSSPLDESALMKRLASMARAHEVKGSVAMDTAGGFAGLYANGIREQVCLGGGRSSGRPGARTWASEGV
jgi:threonine synthase